MQCSVTWQVLLFLSCMFMSFCSYMNLWLFVLFLLIYGNESKNLEQDLDTWSYSKRNGLSSVTEKTSRGAFHKHSPGHTQGACALLTRTRWTGWRMLSRLMRADIPRPRLMLQEAKGWFRERKGQHICQSLNSVYSVNTRSSTSYCFWFCNLHKINICFQKQQLW